MKKLALLLTIVFVVAPSEADACHRFSKWSYPWPQRCSVESFRLRVLPLPPERIEIALPALEWVECPPGDERIVGIAKLRALEDVSRER